MLWTNADEDGIVYSGTVTLHNKGGRNRPPPSYDTVDSYHQDRSMYGDDLVYDEAVFAARDSTLDRARAEPGRRQHAQRQAMAPRSGKVQGRASISLLALSSVSNIVQFPSKLLFLTHRRMHLGLLLHSPKIKVKFMKQSHVLSLNKDLFIVKLKNTIILFKSICISLSQLN